MIDPVGNAPMACDKRQVEGESAMPKALLDEIRGMLEAGFAPHDVADVLGRKAGLDYGEICGIRAAALQIQHGTSASRRGNR